MKLLGFILSVFLCANSLFVSQAFAKDSFFDHEEIQSLRSQPSLLTCNEAYHSEVERLTDNELFALFLNCQKEKNIKDTFNNAWFVTFMATGGAGILTGSGALFASQLFILYPTFKTTTYRISNEQKLKHIHQEILNRGYDVHISSADLKTVEEHEQDLYKGMMTAP